LIFTQLLTLIANISGTSQDIQNRRHVVENDSSHVRQKKTSELWVHYPESSTCEFGPTQVNFF